MRKVEHLPSGRYKVRFRLGRRQTSETFDTRREAVTFAKLLDALGPQGAIDHLRDLDQAARTPTLSEVAADHIRHLTDVTDGTRLNYERLWARTWGERIGRLPVTHVTRDAIADAVNDLAKRYSHKSLKNQRGLLASVLGRAVEEGYLTRSPVAGLRLPRARETERVEMRILTGDEFARLLEHVHEHYRPLVMFLWGTGCRWGEAVALTAADVQLPNVWFRRALKWSPDSHRVVGPTKTPKGNRTVALPPQVVDALGPLLDGKRGSELVFTAPRGGQVQHRTFWSDIWRPAVDAAELDPRPRIHDLRHSHISHLLAAGVPPHIVQRRVGHEDPRTLDNYTHLLPDAQLVAAQAAGLVFAPAIET
jgi:integrase